MRFDFVFDSTGKLVMILIYLPLMKYKFALML